MIDYGGRLYDHFTKGRHMNSEKLIFWLEELSAKDGLLVGNKCANLGEMIQLGMRVPPGFAISANAYNRFAENTGANQEILDYIKNQGKIEGIEKLDEASRTIRSMIEDKEVPDNLMSEIQSAYQTLCKKMGTSDAPAAVRSSGLAEDSAGASFAGQFESYLNVKGEKELLEKVKTVWSSAFTARAISYRIRKGLAIEGDSIGVAVLAMVNARASGISFTVDPVTGDPTKIIIEANWGLGEGVVSGAESVDGFVVNKEDLEVITSHTGKKTRCVVNMEQGAEWADVPPKMQNIACISEEEIKEIAKVAKSVEASLNHPQDMEWAIDQNLPFPESVFFLQTRPAEAQVSEPKSTTDKMIDLITERFFRP
jgi:pyruvate,water dikinase